MKKTETAKEYLNQYKYASMRWRDKKEELMMEMEKRGIMSRGQEADKVQSSPKKDKLERVAIEIVTLEREVELEEKTMKQIEKDIRGTIELVDNWRLRRILLWRYIYNKDWKTIAHSIDRDYKYTVNELHPKALVAIMNAKTVRNSTKQYGTV